MSADDVALLAESLAHTRITRSSTSATSSQHVKVKTRFATALEQTPFTVFKDIEDLGFYRWTPSGPYKRIEKLKPTDILERLSLNNDPPKVKSSHILNRTLPLAFAPEGKISHMNKFPYDHTYLAPLYVATTKRGVNLRDVDFVFGGSTLSILATGIVPPGKSYIASFIPGTRTILLAKHDEYRINLTNNGFQFERFVTGGAFEDEPDAATFEHIQLVSVADKYKIMFCAESDATDENGNPVEIKSSNPRYWGVKAMFQMISSGSVTLCAGLKRGNVLNKVTMQTLPETIAKACHPSEVPDLEKNIISALDALIDASTSGLFDDEEKSFSIGYNDSGLTLTQYGKPNPALPPKDVVSALLATPVITS